MKLIYDHSSNFFFYWLLSCTRSCVTVADLIPRATQLKAKFYIVIAQVSFHKFAKGDRLDMENGYIDLTGQLEWSNGDQQNRIVRTAVNKIPDKRAKTNN